MSPRRKPWVCDPRFSPIRARSARSAHATKIAHAKTQATLHLRNGTQPPSPTQPICHGEPEGRTIPTVTTKSSSPERSGGRTFLAHGGSRGLAILRFSPLRSRNARSAHAAVIASVDAACHECLIQNKPSGTAHSFSHRRRPPYITRTKVRAPPQLTAPPGAIHSSARLFWPYPRHVRLWAAICGWFSKTFDHSLHRVLFFRI